MAWRIFWPPLGLAIKGLGPLCGSLCEPLTAASLRLRQQLGRMPRHSPSSREPARWGLDGVISGP